MRKQLQIRLHESGLERLDKIAAEYGVTRSDVIRACFAVALPTKELRDKLRAQKDEL